MENLKSKESTWDIIVHAPFKKIIKYDIVCMRLGIVMGMGLGAFLVLY